MSICTKCKLEKPNNEFSFKIKSIGLMHRQCKACTRSLIKKHYNNNRQYYLDKTQKRNVGIRLETLKYLHDFLSKNPCIDCGESDITVLEFDHRGEATKLKAVSQLVRNRLPLEKIKGEVEKCDIRCANCHRRKTAKDFGWFKSKTRP